MTMPEMSPVQAEAPRPPTDDKMSGSTMIEFLPNRSRRPHATLVLAHGSGVRMNAPFMTDISEALAAHGVSVLRFEFAYMRGRPSGHHNPPELSREFLDAIIR